MFKFITGLLVSAPWKKAVFRSAVTAGNSASWASFKGAILSPGMAVAVLVGLLLCVAAPGWTDRLYAPDLLWDRGIADKTDPVDIANTHLGIAYRDDGALDHLGRFTTFADPSHLFDTPGLNCSGLVVSVCRFLFDKNWTLEQLSRDRLGNSGANSPLGKDWDFGWDLIFNLSDGAARRVVMPDGREYPLEGMDGLKLRGFDLHDQAAWRAVLSQMKPGHVYLGSISKPSRRPGYKLLHYHVVMMLPDAKGGVWLYHATLRSNAHRMNMNTPAGLQRFMSQFTGSRGDHKDILIVEAALPRLDEADAGAPQAETPAPGAAGVPAPLASAQDEEAVRPGASPVADEQPQTPVAPAARPTDPAKEIVINHLVGKVYKPAPEMNTQVPRFSDESKKSFQFRFQNNGNQSREVDVVVKAPGGSHRFVGKVGPGGRDLVARYPEDFGESAAGPLKTGEYRSDVRLDGAPWLSDIFEVALPREAAPKILKVTAPTVVQAGKAFNVRIEAQNGGAESDYGGITVSCPEPNGLKLKAAAPGRVYPPGSTVLSVTTDRIRTRVPMAERWIELWGENVTYDLNLKIEAGRPGTYPLYIRCALRGVNVKSSVILMDPSSGQTVDQQGFPVYVHNIKVQ